MRNTIILTIIFIMLFGLIYSVNANTNLELYCPYLVNARFTYDGIEIRTSFVNYNDGQNIYPAYCTNKTLDGVTVDYSYNVSIEELKLDNEYNINLWKIISHGYPYVSNESIGCISNEEAFAATKQAIYCYIHGNNPNLYDGIDQSGQRIANAIRTIINNANNDNSNIYDGNCSIEFERLNNFPFYNNWNYSREKDLLFRKYNIITNINPDECVIEYNDKDFKIYDNNLNEIEKTINFKSFIIGIKGSDLKNKLEEKSKTKNNEINTIDDLIINLDIKLDTKAMLYGVAPNENLQSYVITKSPIESQIMKLSTTGPGIWSKLQIKKVDEESNPISDVEFAIYDQTKENQIATITTDENGIGTYSLLPRKYQIKEIKAKDGYYLEDKYYEVTLESYQTTSITIKNKKIKEEKQEEKDEKKEDKVEQIEEIKQNKQEEFKQEIKKLPKTGY